VITDGTVTLGAGDARAMLGRLEPGTARLVVTSPPYLDALDYAAYRAGERQSWYSGARVPMADYLAEHRAVVAALARACADDAIVALEVDGVISWPAPASVWWSGFDWYAPLPSDDGAASSSRAAGVSGPTIRMPSPVIC
jgi:hypothetical protein